MTGHHKAAVITIAAAAVLDTAAGLAFAAAEHVSAWLGLYWAVTTATTVGYGDLAPRTAAGHVLAVIVMLSVVPLFAGAFSLLTSGLTAGHVSRSEARIKAHVSGAVAPGEAVPLTVAGDDHGAKLDVLHADLTDLAHTLRAVLLAQHQGRRP